MNTFWKDRSVLVTGGTGLLGSWIVSRLIEAGAQVVCLVRDWVPQSEGVRNRRIEHVNTVRGDITDRDLLERALGEGMVLASASFLAKIAVQRFPKRRQRGSERTETGLALSLLVGI